MTTATVTRFNTFTRIDEEMGDREVIRLFHKRKLVGEYDIEDVSRESWEETLPEFLANTKSGQPRKTPALLTDVMDFLSSEDGDDEEGEHDGGSVVPEKYREIYGAEQNCGDEVALVLTDYVMTLEGSEDGEPRLNFDALREVATANGSYLLLQKWEDRGLNNGLLRMNMSNVLRGRIRRGEQVQIGARTWLHNPLLLEIRKEARKEARKTAREAKKALRGG